MHESSIRPITLYLPQFHPIPENDEWWGKGFTEWTNVVKAQPIFKGHYQPHLPADLGFYDLRLEEARIAQEVLAKEYGIYGFCYYHYWFNGKRILEQPLDRKLANPKEDLPFMLCWANENWTRTWDGQDKNNLLVQEYSLADDIEHIKSLIPYFKDERYIKVNGKPVFAVYRSNLLPNAKNTLLVWREEARKHGIELYITRFENFGNAGKDLLEDGGFDAAVDFQPFNESIDKFRNKKNEYYNTFLERIKNAAYLHLVNRFDKKKFKAFIESRWNMYDYEEYVSFIKTLPKADYKLFPGITPMWDNTARKKDNFFLFKDATPAIYKDWLKHIKNNFTPYSDEENFVFINAWNEWAEGNHLEPCKKWGRKYLEVTREVFSND